MIKNVFRLSLLSVLAAVFCFLNAAFADESYYTKINIWYEKPEKILSTNYHKGNLLPAGTEVTILKQGSKIKFQDKGGMEYRLILVDDYTALTKEQFFDRYFSKENPLQSSDYRSFSAMEKENIKNGTIQPGMSKSAVLMAFGYPPSHRTPSTAASVWKYWISRLMTDDVHFEGDKVSKIVR